MVSEQSARATPASSSSSETTSPTADRVGAFGQKHFEVDHPFIFLVWDYYSGMLLLMGRVLHPEDIGGGDGIDAR